MGARGECLPRKNEGFGLYCNSDNKIDNGVYVVGVLSLWQMLIYLLIKKKGLFLFSGKVATCLGTCSEAVRLWGGDEQRSA